MLKGIHESAAARLGLVGPDLELELIRRGIDLELTGEEAVLYREILDTASKRSDADRFEEQRRENDRYWELVGVALQKQHETGEFVDYEALRRQRCALYRPCAPP